MLQNEPLDYIREQFQEKNDVLSAWGEKVSAWTLYEDLFGVDHMQDVFPIVVIGEDQGKHILPMPLDEAIAQAEQRNDMLVGACTYFNNWISKRSARDVYGFIIDADNFYSGTLQQAFLRNWATANDDPMPMPTYIVNSGTGLHLYYILTEPIPNYHSSTEILDRIYRALAVQQTSNRVFLHRQVQWFGQDFRMAGGLNKYGWTNSAYKTGHKWDIDELAEAVGVKGVHVRRYDESRQAQPREKRRQIKRSGWKSNPKFYDYALESCRLKSKEGNRYTSMCALTVIAWKCGISLDQLEHDLMGLLPGFNKNATNPVKESEIKSALKMYNDKAMLTQRATLENWQGWEYKPIKRNGRPRAQHIRLMNFVRDEINGNIKWRNRDGAPTKQEAVEEWQRIHPNGRKADCIRETGLSRPTVYKWWNNGLLGVSKS